MSTLGRIAKRVLPAPLVRTLRRWARHLSLWRNGAYDRDRFGRHSYALGPPSNRGQRRAALTFIYHRIEKGLALPQPRAGFGGDSVRDLISGLARYEAKFGRDDLGATVEGVLRDYVRSGLGDPVVAREAGRFLAGRPDLLAERAGTLSLTRDTLCPVSPDIAMRFMESRHSLRSYTGAPLPRELIERASLLAQTAPSVCNRQAGRLYVTNDAARMQEVLSHQNGNRGFGHTLGAVFIVAVDLSAFNSVGERNQPFVDGGIFAMSLVLGLHALGVGACMLNWSSTREADLALRRAFGIPDSHVAITMVGAGEVPEGPFKVAASHRIPPTDVLHWL
ncbi:nitroreductase family protein [Starkeya koreensis]|uniref:Nitroreductase family protein n=1 Tax=Ancylobacter koreensis TaxID=266121 RepID=A0ABT0DGK4_9HYPH|nr:nitroreductase family protein [Ancylobacter koreensis]MCK0206413.1 nitroreductase family protein [Ancylobacter koreensis]